VKGWPSGGFYVKLKNMPANLPPEYLEAEQRYRQAQTLSEKLDALKEMMALVPKHKGTEKLRVDLKRRWAKLNQEIQKRPKAAAHPQVLDHIEKEGAGQVVLVGPPNSGKSTLLATVTKAQPQIADYPFSTFKPTVGMMPFEDIRIQLIDLPPIWEHTEPWVFSLIRNADLVTLVISLSEPAPEEDLLTLLKFLEKARISLVGKRVPSEPRGAGEAKRALLVGTKLDAQGAAANAQSLQALYGSEFPLVCVSAHRGENLEPMKRLMFEALEIVRVYTKKPGRPADKANPYILPKNSTVLELARAIHQELAQKLKYARVWGSAEFDGQRVERNFILQDGDVLELHE